VNARAVGPGVDNAAADQRVHAVSLTYVSRDFRRAVVDGELVREGHRLPDGAYIARITRDSVILMRDGERFGVPVPRALSEHSASATEAGRAP
jgi:hypothetical protein